MPWLLANSCFIEAHVASLDETIQLIFPLHSEQEILSMRRLTVLDVSRQDFAIISMLPRSPAIGW
jgi:hypothetical protein